MQKLLAKIKLFYAVYTNKKIRQQYKLKKKMDKFYRKLRIGLWVLYLVDKKMEELGFSKQEKKQARRTYFSDGLVSSKFMLKLIKETDILKEIEAYERRTV